MQRAAAYQAYYEMMPLRRRSLPQGPDMLLYRKASFGRLAEFFVLDTRQYRTDQPNGDGLRPLNDEALRPDEHAARHSSSGAGSKPGCSPRPATWNVLAQQVMMAHGRHQLPATGPATRWTSGPATAHERMALVQFLADRKVPNPVVLTGDIHSNWVNDLRVDDRKAETPGRGDRVRRHQHLQRRQRVQGVRRAWTSCWPRTRACGSTTASAGYVRCTVTPDNWTSDYVVVEDVTKPGGNGAHPRVLRRRGGPARSEAGVSRGHPNYHRHGVRRWGRGVTRGESGQQLAVFNHQLLGLGNELLKPRPLGRGNGPFALLVQQFIQPPLPGGGELSKLWRQRLVHRSRLLLSVYLALRLGSNATCARAGIPGVMTA